MTIRKDIRIEPETDRLIKEIIASFPNDYKTDSDVLRAGVFALARWKYGEKPIIFLEDGNGRKRGELIGSHVFVKNPNDKTEEVVDNEKGNQK